MTKSDREAVEVQASDVGTLTGEVVNPGVPAVRPVSDLALLRDYRAMTVPAHELGQIIADNGGGRGVNSLDLDRLKIPSGGMTQWTIPSIMGDSYAPEVEGVIVYWRDPQAFWKAKYGTGAAAPPDCASEDGVIGEGDPGGECMTCPMNQWGSKVGDDGKPSRGKACKSTRALFLLRPGSLLPMLVLLPPMSLAVARKYFLGLSNVARPYYGLTTKLTLTKERNAGGLEYSRVAMKPGTELDRDEIQRILAYQRSVAPVLRKVQPTYADFEGAESN